MIRAAFLLPATAALLGGCADRTSGFPSLAPRPIEKLGFAEPEAPAPTPVAADPALDAALAAIAVRLEAVASGFGTDAGKAQASARRAKGRSVGSEAWLDAQAALAGLDDWRAQTSAIVTDLDQLASDRAATLAPDYPALAPLRTRAQAEADRQADTIGKIQASLPAA